MSKNSNDILEGFARDLSKAKIHGYKSRKADNSPIKREDSNVDHPPHYGGKDNTYEAIKVINAWNLDFCLGNAVKYISRAGKKDPTKEIEDLEKASWYIQEKIKNLKEKK